MNHVIGGSAKVEIWNSAQKQSEFFDCEVIGTSTATDRDYRVHVRLPDGREIHHCAPECVIQKSDLKQISLF